MKEEYLWDKTGEDPEIEGLEKALQVFRYKETEPPALRSNVVAFKTKENQSRRVLFFGLAVAACIALAVLALGVWMQISNPQPKGEGLVETVVPKDGFASSDDLEIKEDETRKEMPIKPVAKIRRFAPSATQQNQARNSEIKLTKEEQYAYDQLMRALSITSSKLNLVKKKV